MKKLIIRTLISLSLVIVIITNCASFVMVSDFCRIDYSKISNKLAEKVYMTNEKVSTIVWLQSPDFSEERQELLITAQKFEMKSSDNKTQLDYLNALREKYIEKVGSIIASNNQKFINDYLKKESVSYCGHYLPIVVSDLSRNDILIISSISSVKYMDFFDEKNSLIQNTNSFDEEFPDLPISSVLDGTGVKIGMFDSGIPTSQSLSNYQLSDITLTSDNTYGTYNTTHSSFTTYIAHTYAPEAEFFFAGGDNEYSGFAEIAAFVEWMVEKNVNVLNVSLEIGDRCYSNTPTYSSISSLFDYVAFNYYVATVISSGNVRTDPITNITYVDPTFSAMSYNAITVGAMDYAYSDFPYYYWNDITLYYKGTTFASKPDICALGENGTSESAPRISGIAALMIQECPILIYDPESIKATLTASVDLSSSSYHFVPTNRTINGIDYMKMGAGLVNGANAITVLENNWGNSGSYSTATTKKTFNVTVPNSAVGKTMRVALAFSVPASHSNSTYSTSTMPDLDLYVSAPGYNLSFASNTSFNNVEIVEFTILSGGTHTIEIDQYSSSTEDCFYALAWFYQ